MRRWSAVAALSALLVLSMAPASSAVQPLPIGELDGRIDALREAFGIPGLAIAVVRHDSIVLARGYGIRRVGEAGRIDAETLFAIGSTTKAFTSTAMAMLVGEGALAWDDPVASLLPGFALEDAWLTREITVRDILAHRSGLPMANLLWLSGLHDTGELVRRLRFLEPASGFRSAFSYQNVLYAAAGQIVERTTGSAWGDFVEQRIFDPLGMERSTTSLADLEVAGNVASPHVSIDGAVQPVPYRDIDAIGPAGSILSSAEDMGEWLRFQLSGGLARDGELLDREALLETRRPQILIPPEGPVATFYPDARSLAYGMGWVISEYRGRTLLDHGGGIDGMTTLVAMVPEEGLGVAILTNHQTATPPYWILYPVLDVLLGHEPVDRTDGFRAIADQVEAILRVEPARVDGTRPLLPLESYAGAYESTPLGSARVTLEDGRLVFRFGRFTGPLAAWHFDTFRVEWEDRAWRAAAGPGWITFRLDRAGKVERLELIAIPGETPWTFERSSAVSESESANRP